MPADVYKKQKQKKSKKRKFKNILLLNKKFLLVSFVLCLLVLCYCTVLLFDRYNLICSRIDSSIAQEYHKLISTPITIRAGMDMEQLKLIDRLNARGYISSTSPSATQNSYTLEGNNLHLAGPNHPEGTIIHLDGPLVTKITTETNVETDRTILPPLTLNKFVESIWEVRVPLRYTQIPQELITAVLAAEDRHFFSHNGIDFSAVCRAALANIKEGRITQGGSTISQQLVKIIDKREQRIFSKKLEEIVLTLAIELTYSKEDILSTYLNNLYLGQVGRFEIRGMEAAANLILQKRLRDCEPTDYAMLAGLIRSPNSASPSKHPIASAKRTAAVIKQINKANFTPSSTQLTSFNSSLFAVLSNPNFLGYYYDRLESEMKDNHFYPLPVNPPLTFQLGLDPFLQKDIMQIMQDNLASLEQKKGLPANTIQGAMVILENETGIIKASAGGRDYNKSQFNRAFKANRQIGSLIKPFIYLPQLGGTSLYAKATQATIIRDSRIKIDFDGNSWTPHNYDKKFLGFITIREALAKSRNIPAVRMGLKSGIDVIVNLLKSIRINKKPSEFPSLFLGACEASPATMASAYGTIANGGKLLQPTVIRSVSTLGKTIWKGNQPELLLNPAACYVVSDILQSVFTNGTAKSAKNYNGISMSAGKTGTTSKMRDSWFAGFTPQLTAVTWIGRDDNKPINLTGSSGALPIWVKCMNVAIASTGITSFTPPPGIIFANINQKSGKAERLSSPATERMAFIEGTVPTPDTIEKIAIWYQQYQE
jgi:penicillin-binding protein 1B